MTGSGHGEVARQAGDRGCGFLPYLRTSYAVTTLQENDVAWRNMLQRHGIKTMVPLLPDLIEQEDSTNRIVNEIDKQFWQTINQVRVAGGGTTNYAIAKDDLGNWYVKNYSTDVGKVAQSARKLVLYARGGAVPQLPFDTPLTGTLTPAEAAAREAEIEQKDPAYLSSLGKTFEKFETAYREANLSVLKSLRDSAQQFEKAIEANWTKLGMTPEERKLLLPKVAIGEDVAIKKSLIELTDEKIAQIKKGDEGKTLSAAMADVRSYYSGAVSAIKDTPTSTMKNTAIKGLTQVVLKDTLQKRIGGAK